MKTNLTETTQHQTVVEFGLTNRIVINPKALLNKIKNSSENTLSFFLHFSPISHDKFFFANLAGC